MCPCWGGTWILSAPFLVRLKGFNRRRRPESNKQQSVARPALVVVTLREAPARDLFPLGQHQGMGYEGIRLQARRSRPAGKRMRPCWRPLQAAWRGGPPRQTARKRACLKNGQNVSVGRPPKLPQFGENDPSTEFPRKRRSELRNDVAATLAHSRDLRACKPVPAHQKGVGPTPVAGSHGEGGIR
jgi:hypothetical protein